MFVFKNNFTFGSEIEAVDFDRREIDLPEGCSWAKKEVTLVNSNGLAVDSTKKSENFLGGEINTPATNFEDQKNVIRSCFDELASKGAEINYRCNFQTHVGLPVDWTEDQELEALKKIQKWVWENSVELIIMTMGEGQYNRKPEMPYSFWRHYIERPVDEQKHIAMLEAKTLKEFQNAFFLSKTGKHAFQTFQRQFINTHSFFKHRTIEFRNFWATLDIDYAISALLFSGTLIDSILNGNIKKEWPSIKHNWEYSGDKRQSKFFPPELPFNLDLETGFQKTKVKKP